MNDFLAREDVVDVIRDNKPKTIEQIKDELYELSERDFASILDNLIEITLLANSPSASSKCREIAIAASEATEQLEAIQSFLSNYPIRDVIREREDG